MQDSHLKSPTENHSHPKVPRWERTARQGVFMWHGGTAVARRRMATKENWWAAQVGAATRTETWQNQKCQDGKLVNSSNKCDASTRLCKSRDKARGPPSSSQNSLDGSPCELGAHLNLTNDQRRKSHHTWKDGLAPQCQNKKWWICRQRVAVQHLDDRQVRQWKKGHLFHFI